jgi:DNA polymerase (family 10)
MKNQELADVFDDLADMEEIETEIDPGAKWKAIAYRNAAVTLRNMNEDVEEIYKQGRLREIPGIGEKIAAKIEEYLKTGKITKHEELKKKYPINFKEFRNIEGIGPKRLYVLYKYLGITNLEQLKKAIEEHKIRNIPGFGEKSEQKMKEAIEMYEKTTVAERKPLAYCWDYINGIVDKLRSSGLFERVEIAGSTRRMKETIGDVDVLGISDNPKAMDFFVSLPEVKQVIVKGETKTTVLLDLGLTCDLRVLDRNSFGAALQYFTGSKEHNIKVRKYAQDKGYKLSEYGLFKDDQMIAGKTEEEVYNALGMDWIPPELREDMGEVEAALEHKLPKLVEYNEVIGDLHAHTKDSDGSNSLEEMVEAAIKRGLKYIAITNHTKSLPVSGGMDENELLEFINRARKVSERYKQITILVGAEIEILKDGSLDLSPNVIHQLDYAIAALHQWTNMSKEELTQRYLKAINSGLVSAIAHPTNREIGTRPPLDVDYDKLFEACEKNDVVCEIDGNPLRSDLPYDLVKKAKVYKIMFHVGSDAHSTDQLRYLFFATAIARRGWLEKERVLNTYDVSRVLSYKR